MYSILKAFSILYLFSSTSSTNTSCPEIITRSQWNARQPTEIKNLTTVPPPIVIIHHSVTPQCLTKEECKKRMYSIQSYHMIDLSWEDIGYNFLIGGNGEVYEGRGWGIHGAHARGYNSKSIGICLIGNYEIEQPSNSQLQAIKELIECGVELGEIAEDYELIGHKEASATLCPGKNLYQEIMKWSHFKEQFDEKPVES